MTTTPLPNAVFSTRRERTNEERSSIRQVAEALALFAKRNDRSLFDALDPSQKPMGELGMFALNDITLGGTQTATRGVVDIMQPQWLGALWAGRSYTRRIIPLFEHADLTSFKVSGYRWKVKPQMSKWAGNKAAIPTNTPEIEAYDTTAQRYAGGHDIGREFRDFTVPEFWESYFTAMTESYAQNTDDQALADVLAAATPVERGDIPVGVNPGLVSIVDGALAVLPKGVPSFAVVAADIFRSIALTKDIDKLAFLNTSLGLEEGTMESFRVVPHPGIAAGKTLVGIKGAATVYELPGSPIRTEALDQIKGGIDEALFGYAATAINEPAALALVSPAAS